MIETAAPARLDRGDVKQVPARATRSSARESAPPPRPARWQNIRQPIGAAPSSKSGSPLPQLNPHWRSIAASYAPTFRLADLLIGDFGYRLFPPHSHRRECACPKTFFRERAPCDRGRTGGQCCQAQAPLHRARRAGRSGTGCLLQALVTPPVGPVDDGRGGDLSCQLEQLRDEQIQKHAGLRLALAPSIRGRLPPRRAHSQGPVLRTSSVVEPAMG